MTRVLVVGPDRAVDEGLLDALAATDGSIERISDATSALASMDRIQPDVVVAASDLPEWSGLRLLRHVESEHPDVATFLLVADDLDAITAAQRADITPLVADRADWPELVDVMQDRVFASEVDDNRNLHRHLSVATAEVLLESMESLNRASNYRQSPDLLQETAIASARDMVEQSICSKLNAVPDYAVVWVSHYYEDTNELEPQAAAGADVHQLRDRSLVEFADAGDELRDGEIGVRIGEQFVEALVPLLNEEDLHGAIHVQKQGRAYSSFEQNQLNQLGRTVGRFITALERRHEIAGSESAREAAGDRSSAETPADEGSRSDGEKGPGSDREDRAGSDGESVGTGGRIAQVERSEDEQAHSEKEIGEELHEPGSDRDGEGRHRDRANEGSGRDLVGDRSSTDRSAAVPSEDLDESTDGPVSAGREISLESEREDGQRSEAATIDEGADEVGSADEEADMSGSMDQGPDESHSDDGMSPIIAYSDTIAHELRNHVNVAQAFLDLGRNQDDGENFDRVEMALDRIERLTDEAAAVARGDVDSTQMGAGGLQEDARVAFERVEGEAELVVEDDVTVTADHDLLVLLLENLFRNAVDHVGPDVGIRIGSLPDGEGFFVEDDGPGIPESERDRLFGWGVSGGESDGGIGLAIVKRIVENHGWDVAITDGTEGGARFEITDVEIVE